MLAQSDLDEQRSPAEYRQLLEAYRLRFEELQKDHAELIRCYHKDICQTCQQRGGAQAALRANCPNPWHMHRDRSFQTDQVRDLQRRLLEAETTLDARNAELAATHAEATFSRSQIVEVLKPVLESHRLGMVAALHSRLKLVVEALEDNLDNLDNPAFYPYLPVEALKSVSVKDQLILQLLGWTSDETSATQLEAQLSPAGAQLLRKFNP